VRNALNIVLGGEAGQGLVTVGHLLAKSLVRGGYSICVTQSYQSRIRGGHNTFAIRVSPDDVQAPCEAIDVLAGLDAPTVTLHESELSPDGMVIVDEAVKADCAKCVPVPFRELATGIYVNTAALGVVAQVLGLDLAVVRQVMLEAFGKKVETVAENEKALEAATKWAAENVAATRPLPPAPARSARLMMTGNDALAFGAASAGLRFCAFYPMTPSTSIPTTLAGWGESLGIVVEQAEDEIAAINMALGASYAGAPSLVTTSGGGFALMVEGVSLAGMTETPVVIVVGQRPGPATGLPTRTEQADLEFVLHAGHGEFPRAIFAPGSVEECFHLSRRAFELAERCQSPVFLLTDQFLADSYRAVEPFAIEGLPQVRPWEEAPAVKGPYRRYAITSDGVSPRLLPGGSEHLVVVDSDEHDEVGHITEDLTLRKAMVEKRLRKLEGMRGEVVPPEHTGDGDPELLLVCWGSTKGSVVEAAEMLRADARRVGVLHFSQVWPLVPEQFMGLLHKAREVVSVEGNAFGQFARLLRRETGFEVHRQVLRYDGLPHTPESVVRGSRG